MRLQAGEELGPAPFLFSGQAVCEHITCDPLEPTGNGKLSSIQRRRKVQTLQDYTQLDDGWQQHHATLKY